MGSGRTRLETLLLRLVAWLRQQRRAAADPNRPPHPLAGCLNFVFATANLGNLAGVILLALLIPYVGQRWWPLSIVIFLPPLAALVPTLVLLVPTALWGRRWLPATLAALGLGILAFLQPVWSFRPTEAPGDLAVVTNNFGQHNQQSLRPFLEAKQPDIILLQEAVGRGPAFARAFPEHAWRAHGELVLLSRLPIRESGYVPDLGGQVARFVIDLGSQELVVYNVHLTSPRRELLAVTSPRTLWEALTGRTGPGSRIHAYRERLDRRIDTVLALRDVLEAEQSPFIVGGDFNLPAGTWLYRELTRNLADAHRRAGRGFGYTFPGETSRLLALRSPWLRIDYLFAGPGIDPVHARTEPRRRSQHRAVSARFRIEPGEGI